MTIISGPSGLGDDALEGLQEISELGLKAVELSFTHGVRMSNEKARKIGVLAKKLGISLSIHGPYYINLNSEEKDKRVASKKRILDSCERGYHMGAEFVVFHPAYYMKSSKEKCYEAVKKAIIEMQDKIKKKGWKVMLAPELTGKPTQFGDIDELVKLSKETGCAVCIDFAHHLARHGERTVKGVLTMDSTSKNSGTSFFSP